VDGALAGHSTVGHEDQGEGLGVSVAGLVEPDFHRVEVSRTGLHQNLMRRTCQQHGLGSILVQIPETLLCEHESLLPCLQEFVAPSLGEGVPLAPEAIDERLALVVVLKCLEDHRFRLGDERCDDFEPEEGLAGQRSSCR
jgi:hypothetical protein